MYEFVATDVRARKTVDELAVSFRDGVQVADGWTP